MISTSQPWQILAIKNEDKENSHVFSIIGFFYIVIKRVEGAERWSYYDLTSSFHITTKQDGRNLSFSLQVSRHSL